MLEATVAEATAASRIEVVYREEGDRLWRSLVAFSGDPELASDAVAEAFAQALRRGDALRSPAPWVWRAAFRIAAGQLRDRRRAVPATNAGSYVMRVADPDVLDALSQLPDAQRAAVVLQYYADQPVREVARVTGQSAVAVRMNLSRARRRLRSLLESTDA